MIETSLISWNGQGFGHTVGGERVLSDFLDLSNRCEIPQKASSEEGQCQGIGYLNGCSLTQQYRCSSSLLMELVHGEGFVGSN